MSVNKHNTTFTVYLKLFVLLWFDLMQALRARSMLHCVCLKPYNSRFMVSCSQCGEWYHTYCVKLHWRPEAYVCFACCPPAESSPKNDPSRFVSLPSKNIGTNFYSCVLSCSLYTFASFGSLSHHQSYFSCGFCGVYYWHKPKSCHGNV